MKTKILFILMGSFLFLQSCATSPTIKMAAVASLGQKTAYDGTVTSQKKHFVSLSPYNKLYEGIIKTGVIKNKTMFMLTVQNCGENPVKITTDNVSVIFKGPGEDWAPNKINIQSYDDFMNSFEKEYNDNEKKFIYSILYRVWSLCQIGGMDSERATDKMRDLKYDIKSMRRQNEVLREMMPRFILKNQVITPGNSYTGIVVCDTHEIDPEIEGNFQVSVSIDEERHEFTFYRGLNNSK